MATKNRGFRSLVGAALGDLDYFPVAGITDEDAAFGIVDGLHHSYFYDASLAIVANNSPYQIIPDDNASGTGAWVLSGFQGAISHVRAHFSSAQSISDSTSTILIPDTEEYDLLSEYNDSTGVFTALFDGVYNFTCQLISASASWTTSKGFSINMYKNGTIASGGHRSSQEGLTTASYALATGSIDLVATDYIDFRAFQNQGAAVDIGTNTYGTFITIDRIV